MTKLVFITQQVDPGHPALAATVPKIRTLAAHVDEVVVLADGAVPGVLPDNCRVRTFRAPHKALRGARFEAALGRELRGLRGGAVVAHMCPIYAVLAAPLVRPLGVPLVLWFTHWRASGLLRAAERVSTAVTSVDERSFPLASRKLRAIGHGIDLDEFPCSPPRDGDGLRLLALGRYSTAKGLDVSVAAVPLAGDDVELHVHGPALSDEERAHRVELEQLVSELGLGGRVTLGDAVPRSELPELFARHDVLVNNMRAGAPDKVVYEAAASCLPVLASNPIFDELLEPEQRFTRWDPGALAERVRALAQLSRRRARRPRPAAPGARGRRALGGVVGARHPWRGGPLVRDGVVLHTQKVAGISGSEAHLLQLLPDLRERGWDIRFLMLHEDEPGAWEFADALRARGVPLDDIRLRADVDPVAFGQVTAHLARVRPRILHTHLVHADVYGQLAGSVARIPLRLSTKHGFNEFREGRWFGFADRSVGSLAHVHIAISQGLAQYLAETEGFDEADFEIVHYGIASAGDATPYDRPEPRLLCVGRLIPIKGHLVLLRALAQARARVPDVVLDVAGRGPLEPALKAYARELGLEDAVRFLGFVSPVQKAVENAAIVVVPSLGEGFGMVALEAHGAGAAGDRERRRRASRDRRRRRDRPRGPARRRRGARGSHRRARWGPAACGRHGSSGTRARARGVHARALRRAGRGALRARSRACADVVPLSTSLDALPG